MRLHCGVSRCTFLVRSKAHDHRLISRCIVLLQRRMIQAYAHLSKRLLKGAQFWERSRGPEVYDRVATGREAVANSNVLHVLRILQGSSTLNTPDRACKFDPHRGYGHHIPAHEREGFIWEPIRCSTYRARVSRLFN